LDKKLSNGFLPQEKLEKDFYGLLEKLIEIENQPSTPATTKRKMKIILAGLDDSGKTSFIYIFCRQFSKILPISPTKGAKVESIQALGGTIFLWDLGGQMKFRNKYLSKSQIYIYESDLIFYFIDIKNDNRFKESLNYFKQIYEILTHELEQNTPIIFIFSKGDPDIVRSKAIQKNIEYLQKQLEQIFGKKVEYYITSIFQIESVLRAFSAGISELSLNRELLYLNLKRFSNKIRSYLTLLLSNEGLVLADYYSKKINKHLHSENNKERIQNVFEITAPQFTMLLKLFYKFKAVKKEEALFKIADSIILIKRLKILENGPFILFLIDKKEKKKKINELLPKFTKKVKDLLSTYIH
jgi:GTPase SAR1 family protein